MVPHPVPYQGSKRRLAPVILRYLPEGTEALIEPFAGSAAVTLAAAAGGLAKSYLIADSLEALVEIWQGILDRPCTLAARYERIWCAQRADPRAHYLAVRDAFNRGPDPARLLYLLARCVKNAVRFNAAGDFNQSADHRRKGMNPAKMRVQIEGAHKLLAGRTRAVCGDYAALLDEATNRDFVYLDPPYQGVTGRDPRYFQQLDLESLLNSLERLNSRAVPYVLSFDGLCGTRKYGRRLPQELKLRHRWVHTGRSSQATLNGRDDETTESLYISPAVRGAARIGVFEPVTEMRQRSCLVPDQADERDLDILIQTGLSDPIAIVLAENLLEEAGIPFFVMDRNGGGRQDVVGWWSVRVPKECETETREILHSIEQMK